MMNFSKAKELFKDKLDTSLYFDSQTSLSAKKRVLDIIRTGEYNLIFLLGEPGSGKTYLIKLLNQELKSSILSIVISNPFFTEEKLMKILLDSINRYDIDPADTKRVQELYQGIRHTIFIDEAQLLNERQIELIRILSDTKVFNFVLAMHEREGYEILEKPHFKTRLKDIINIGRLREDEILRYIQSTFLLDNETQEFSYLFDKKIAKIIYKWTKGNFRTIKNYLHTLLELYEYAQEREMEKYLSINSCLLRMTAIDLELLK